MLTYEFWKEVTERVEEGDITEDILLQLGVLVSSMMWGWEVGRGEELQKTRRREDLWEIENIDELLFFQSR